jgi:hypothetical protein
VSFFRWERYGSWIVPDAFPPIGGDDAMYAAGKSVRDSGAHLKHLFSCNRYWLHEDISDDYFEKVITPMAAIQRGQSSRKALTRSSGILGNFVIMCPSSQAYQQCLVQHVDKVADYGHDIFSMDIWPASQPVPCYNPKHAHPPGLGRWYVDANIEMIEKMQATAFARQPEAIFGGEGMTEPYMPYFHTHLMRHASDPVTRDRGRITEMRVPMFDYVYGDLFVPWGGYSTTRTDTCKADTALQFVRRQMLHICDKWHPRLFDMKETQRTGKVTLLASVELGDDAAREADLKFAARLQDFETGEFNEYFASGRIGRFPECYVKQADGEWRKMLLYDTKPAIGTLIHPNQTSLIWLMANGWDDPVSIWLRVPEGKTMVRTVLRNDSSGIDFNGSAFLEVTLDPLEIAAIEWE